MTKTILVIMGIFIIALACVVIKIGLDGSKTAKEIVNKTPIREAYKEVQAQEDYCSINQVSQVLLFIIISLEDWYFFKHKGYQPYRIFNSFIKNVLSLRNKMGGSTITQQLAKNVYLTFHKTYKRKVTEFFLARMIEKELKKEEILDWYLNIIFYGRKNNNIKSACKYYFGKHPSEITLNEAISIASILPAPTKYHPLNENGYFVYAKEIGLEKLVRRKVILEEDLYLFRNIPYNEVLTDEKALAYERKCVESYNQIRG